MYEFLIGNYFRFFLMTINSIANTMIAAIMNSGSGLFWLLELSSAGSVDDSLGGIETGVPPMLIASQWVTSPVSAHRVT